MSDASTQASGAYFVPHGTRWPILGSFGLFFTVGGAALWLNEVLAGKYIMGLGIAMLLAIRTFRKDAAHPMPMPASSVG